MREKIKLESTAGTGHFYTTDKNKRNMPEKMLRPFFYCLSLSMPPSQIA